MLKKLVLMYRRDALSKDDTKVEASRLGKKN